MACLLWENSFYESGEDCSHRIIRLIPQVPAEKVATVAIEAREEMKLRHVPLLLVREMAIHNTHKHLVAKTLQRVIQRPDELTEFLAIYWKDAKVENGRILTPLANQVKKGLAAAFTKFSEYQLAKWNKDGAIKLRDVMFLVHPKPRKRVSKEEFVESEVNQEDVFKKLASNTLEPPVTWEVALSSGADKKETWTRLLREKKLGALALLRNLRNMKEAGVNEDEIILAIKTM